MNQNAMRALVPALGLVLAGMALAVEPATTMPAKQPASAAAAASPAEQDKTLYALGVMLSRGLESFQLSEAEFSKVNAGLADGYHHKSSAAGVDAYMSQVQALQHSRAAVVAQHEKAAGQAYLDKAAAGSPGATKTASGLLCLADPRRSGQGQLRGQAD